MPYLQIDGRRLFYQIHGQGEPLILMHHGFASCAMWDHLIPALNQAGFQVLAYDRRGYGQSDPGEDFAAFYVADEFREHMVADLVGLLDSLGWDKIHFLGHCEGGITAIDFAAALPERVTSLVVSSVQTWSMVDMFTFNREKFPKSFAELDPKLREKFQKWHGERAEELYEMGRTKGGAYGVGFFNLRPKLPLVKCPSLVIYPDRSALFDVEQGVALYRGLPCGELAVMPACGHNTYEYQPGEYLRLFLDFHQRQRERAYLPRPRGGSQGPDPTQATCAT